MILPSISILLDELVGVIVAVKPISEKDVEVVENCVCVVLETTCNTAPEYMFVLATDAAPNLPAGIEPAAIEAALMAPVGEIICTPVLLKNPIALIVANVVLPTFKLN